MNTAWKRNFLIPGTGQHKYGRDSFLFTLVNSSGTGPIKMPLRGTSNHNGISYETGPLDQYLERDMTFWLAMSQTQTFQKSPPR